MRILLVGAGGYAANYVRALLGNERADVQLVGIVDPYVKASAEYDRILESNVPLYETMEQFYSESSADLAVIGTPIFLHCEQSVTALKHGSYVLCEKPAAQSPEEAQKMLDAEREYGKFIAIGYQWSFSNAIIELKKDIMTGFLGAPVSMKSIVCWPRKFAYYNRGGGWAGKIEKDGILILDSIASNASAHYLHNMLFLLGSAIDESAFATDIEADCLRAYDIETFDTCAIRARAAGVPIYLIASHTTEYGRDPEFVFEFEKARVTYSQKSGEIIASFADGSVKSYGNPTESSVKKMWDTVDAISRGKIPVCTVKAAMAHTVFIRDLHKCAVYRSFDKDMIVLRSDESGLYVKGLLEHIARAYDSQMLLSEIN